MEETKDDNVPANLEKRSGDDGFPWEEWTVIDEGEDPKNHTTSQLVKSSTASSDTSYSDIDNTSDAEEARECIQVLPEEILEQCPSVRSSEESVDQHNDESDGVSVITESDVDESNGDANADREVVVYENVSRAPAERMEGNADRIFMKVLNVMIACSLVAVIGLGAGRVLNMEDNRPISTELDLVTLKMESSRLLEQMKELSGVKDILEEIKSSMLQDRISDTTKLRNPTENEAKTLPYLKKQFKTLDPSINKQDSTLYERLQIFLRTICLVLEDIRQPNSDSETFQSTCDTHSRFSDLKNLHKLLNSVIDGLEPSEKSTHQRFLQNIDFQMNSMSDSLISDLTRALDKLSVKNQKRLGKIGFKLNERLCVLRNTLPSDSKLRESLEKNNTFLDNCEDIATRKSDEKSKEKWREGRASNDEKEKWKEGSELKDQKEKWRGSSKQKDEKEKWKRGSKSIDMKKNFKKREAPVIPNFNKKTRGFLLKRQNATSPYETVEMRKCYSNNLPSFMHDSQDPDNTCAMLMAPPRSDWKMKHKSFKADREKGQKYKRKNLDEEWPGKILLKGDRGASKIWKKASSKKFEKFRKTSASSNEDDDTETMERMKERLNEKIRSGVVLSEPPNTNTEGKYKRTDPPTPTVHRVKKNFDKENNEFIVAERHDTNSKVEGNWQFERSRIRDQLRNEDSTGNWYFDRVGNRKNARLNCDTKNQDPRCGKLHH